MTISQQLTLPMPAIRRPAYPRRTQTMRIVRIVSLLLLVAILLASGMLYFSTPSSLSIFDAKPTPTVAPCARITLIEANGKLTQQIDEVCQP